MLQGDPNTNFFHQYANGRRRKNTITSLETDGGPINSLEDITNHATAFYKSLFSSGPPVGMRLADNFWEGRPRISLEEGESLIKEFTKEEVKTTIFGMKSASAPRPNGFGVHFFKTFWYTIKGDYMSMFQDFHGGDLNVKRPNYGVITLVPKIQEANNIKQYRPICLLNVDYKGITKVLMNRFSPVASKIIGSNQTGFVKGRNILEGVVILHEVIRELKRSKNPKD